MDDVSVSWFEEMNEDIVAGTVIAFTFDDDFGTIEFPIDFFGLFLGERTSG